MTSGRIGSGRIGSAHGPPRRRASAFAQAIAARYSNGRHQWPAVNLTLRQSRPAVVTHSTNRQTHLHISPRLSLAFASGGRRAGGSNIEQPVIIERIQETARKTVLRHSISELMIERLVARQVRLSSLGARAEARNTSAPRDRAGSNPMPASPVGQTTAALPSGNVAPSYHETAAPVPRVLRRNAIKEGGDGANDSKTKHDDAARAAVIADQLAVGSFQQRSVPPRVTLSDQDLGRLTDQVVKSIDKRIIAARERAGRS